MRSAPWRSRRLTAVHSVACCMLSVVCCMLSVVCCMLSAACHLPLPLPAAHELRCSRRHLSHPAQPGRIPSDRYKQTNAFNAATAGTRTATLSTAARPTAWPNREMERVPAMAACAGGLRDVPSAPSVLVPAERAPHVRRRYEPAGGHREAPTARWVPLSASGSPAWAASTALCPQLGRDLGLREGPCRQRVPPARSQYQ